MIPVPEAEAAYNRVTHFQTQAGDLDLLVAAATQPGMPAPIVALGTKIKECRDAHDAYVADPSEANAATWTAAETALRDLIVNHLDLAPA